MARRGMERKRERERKRVSKRARQRRAMKGRPRVGVGLSLPCPCGLVRRWCAGLLLGLKEPRAQSACSCGQRAEDNEAPRLERRYPHQAARRPARQLSPRPPQNIWPVTAENRRRSQDRQKREAGRPRISDDNFLTQTSRCVCRGS